MECQRRKRIEIKIEKRKEVCTRERLPTSHLLQNRRKKYKKNRLYHFTIVFCFLPLVFEMISLFFVKATTRIYEIQSRSTLPKQKTCGPAQFTSFPLVWLVENARNFQLRQQTFQNEIIKRELDLSRGGRIRKQRGNPHQRSEWVIHSSYLHIYYSICTV